MPPYACTRYLTVHLTKKPTEIHWLLRIRNVVCSKICLRNLNCAGSESTSEGCAHSGWRSQDCNHEESAGVVCAASNGNSVCMYVQLPFVQFILLMDPQSMHEGRVEVYITTGDFEKFSIAKIEIWEIFLKFHFRYFPKVYNSTFWTKTHLSRWESTYIPDLTCTPPVHSHRRL